MVLKRKRKFDLWDIDSIFDLVEDQIRKSLEFTRRLLERYGTDFRTPLADIYDEGDKYILEVELPGMNKEDIEIYTYDHSIEIVAKRKLERKEEREGAIRIERAFAGFRRVFTLPPDADLDKIKAKYENGVLILEIPKKGHKKKVEIE